MVVAILVNQEERIKLPVRVQPHARTQLLPVEAMEALTDPQDVGIVDRFIRIGRRLP